ncbi:nitroreductase family protein [Sorangium sp. So ce590]|uniref:nitroreductase family protein n=1 Tax=unclassified Sorangium TaxID=2621164 RepID=UPI003F5E9598
MTLEELLRSRRSVRRFLPEPPPDGVIERLIELAVTAPSASNKQPWRFVVVKRPEAIAAMASAVREAVATVAEHVPPDSQGAFVAYGDYFTRFEGAPVVIAPIYRGHTVLSGLVAPSLPAALRETIAAMERDSGLTGASLALMSLLLAAHDAGLGASAMTGPLLAAGRLKEILGVPASWGIVALVAVGYAAGEPAPTDRKAGSKVTRWIR